MLLAKNQKLEIIQMITSSRMNKHWLILRNEIPYNNKNEQTQPAHMISLTLNTAELTLRRHMHINL